MINSDIWSDDELRAAREEYLEPRTLKEFQKWLHQYPNYNLIAEASSLHPIDYTTFDHPIKVKEFLVCKIAEVKSFDLKPIVSDILERNKDVTATSTKITKSRLGSNDKNFLIDYNFDRETQMEDVTDCSPFTEIGNLFEFEDTSVIISYQPPGCVEPRHTDFLDSMWSRFIKEELAVIDLPFNTVTKAPNGYYAIRVILALENFYPGHIFGFEDKVWSPWKQGDVVTFDWAHCRHYTANASFVPRLFLKMSGVTQNKNHWIFNNVNNDMVTSI